MSVDGINSKDASYAAKRRAVEEERAEELSDVEKRYREQVKTARSARASEARKVKTEEAKEIEEFADKSKKKINDTREAHSERIRSYQEDSDRMTQEAQKKLQHKATELNRFTKELGDQREILEKKHNHSSTAIQENRSKNFEKVMKEQSTELGEQAERQNAKSIEMRNKNREELAYLREEGQIAKTREKSENQKDLGKLKTEKELGSLAYQTEIQNERERFANQLGGLRQDKEKVLANQMGKYDESMMNMEQKNKYAMNREMISGQRQLNRTKSFYDDQIREQEKGRKKEVADAYSKTQSKLASIETDEKTQEHMMLRSHYNRKQNITASTNAQLETQTKQAEEVKSKLAQEHLMLNSKLKENHEKVYSEQGKIMQAEYQNQSERSTRALNDNVASTATALGAYSSKKSDPFYQLKGLDASVSDNGESWVVSVKVPEHEQEKIKINTEKGRIIVNGARRSENKAKLEDGRTIATNTYQSFTETVPVEGKPDGAKMVRSYSGGTLTVKIPKA